MIAPPLRAAEIRRLYVLPPAYADDRTCRKRRIGAALQRACKHRANYLKPKEIARGAGCGRGYKADMIAS
jgi:hypothetical protein